MHLIYLLAIFTAAANLFLAGFVFFKNPKKKANIFFSLFSLASAFWILSTYSAIYTNYPLLLGRLSFSAVIAGLTFLLFFVLTFPNEKIITLRKIIAASILPLVFIIVSFTGLLVKEVAVIDNHLSGTFGQAYFIYRFFNIFYSGLILYILFVSYKKSSFENKLKIKYLLLGLAMFIIPAAIANMVLPGFFNNRNYNNLGPLFSVFMVSFTSYSIIKHRLMDINIIIQRSLIYSLLLGVVVTFYLGLVFVSGELFQKASDITILISAGLTAIVGIFTVPLIENFFRRTTDRFFFKDRYNYSEALDEVSEILNVNIDLANLIKEAGVKVRKIFKLKHVALIFWKQGTLYTNGQALKFNIKPFINLKELRSNTVLEEYDNMVIKDLVKQIENKCEVDKFTLVVPIILHNETLATMLLGDKRSGDPYSVQDLKLLKTCSYQAGVALEKARLFEAEKTYAQELEKKVKRRTNKIQELQEEQKRMMLEISHELQTPLTIAKIGLEKIKQNKALNPDMLSFEKSVDWISRFVYDLLKLTRLEMADSFKFETINLSELLSDQVEYYETLAQNQDITLIHKIEQGLIIRADKHKIEDLTNTLMSNAIKYIANKKQIDIQLKKHGRFAELTIKDTGVGIMAKNLPLIFKRYFMEKRPDNITIKGSGLGLAIAKKIVDGHNGSISVKSLEKKGSSFTVSLPIKP